MPYIQNFAYQVMEGKAAIIRCFSSDNRAVIPEELDGYPVTEIAPYAFSEHLPNSTIIEGIQSKSLRTTGQGLPDSQKTILCGKRLEEIWIPATVLKIGAYTFYNCTNLKKLTFSSGIRDWGTGAFTGCHRIEKLEVQTDKERPSTLKEVLTELKEELCVRCTGEENSLLMFPEYFEEGVENTPARILETHVHGTGLYYRNCFQMREFDYQEYDTRFRYAKAQECPGFLQKLVFGRLQYPYKLAQEAEKTYLDYLQENRMGMAADLVQKRDLDNLKWLMEKAAMGYPQIREVLELAGQSGFTEGISYLMNLEHSRRPKSKERERFFL